MGLGGFIMSTIKTAFVLAILSIFFYVIIRGVCVAWGLITGKPSELKSSGEGSGQYGVGQGVR